MSDIEYSVIMSDVIKSFDCTFSNNIQVCIKPPVWNLSRHNLYQNVRVEGNSKNKDSITINILL